MHDQDDGSASSNSYEVLNTDEMKEIEEIRVKSLILKPRHYEDLSSKKAYGDRLGVANSCKCELIKARHMPLRFSTKYIGHSNR
jgi:hypothetical protein